MPRSARESFINGPHRVELEKIVQTASFEVACHTALLALVEEQQATFVAPESSWQIGVHLAGARRVLEILSTLHQPETQPEKQKIPSLNYRA